MTGLATTYFSSASHALFLNGLNECLKENVLDLRAGIHSNILIIVWNVTLNPFVQEWGTKMPLEIHLELINFFGLVGQSSNGRKN